MLVEGVAVEYIVEIKVFTDAADDSKRVHRNPAELVGQAVEEDLALDNVAEPFDLEILKAQSSLIQLEILLLGNLHEPSGNGSGLHPEHFWGKPATRGLCGRLRVVWRGHQVA